MTTRGLFRLAAAALIISGVCMAIGLILHPMPPFHDSVGNPRWVISHLFWWIGGLAGIVGLAGLYLRQRDLVGALGFVGAALSILGLGLLASALYFEAFIAPAVATREPRFFESFPTGGGWEGFLAGLLASGALLGPGFLLFGIAIVRAGSMPRGAIMLTMVGGLPFAVSFLLPRPVAILAATALGAGLLWLGMALWRSVDHARAWPVAATSAT